MLNIRNELLKIHHDLQQKIECPSELIERLRSEGKSLEQTELALLELNRIQGVFDSIETALKILEL
ncbi:hypothetical protein GMB51_15335 [Turicibacter sanguinis]|nr:hypothetical protein [Turicibacter sanguinis]MTN52264.1 hypothetical protein [Turicibacter sanguinis]MTN55396.1 hypothetical protein [Turicibacter sanguinis]MTN58664.1 hypothetical protein [Turicibacter sanguinis]MTN61668.1 hypothetical protein [Turicibacter sanguinis]